MTDKQKNILIIIAYWFFATGLLGSIGVWLPLVIDYFSIDHASVETYKSLASNMLTYGLSIFLIAAIDRIIHLLYKTSAYSNHVLEFFGILLSCIGTAFIVFFSLKALKNSLFEDAIKYARYLSIIAWAAWFYVKLQGSKTNNYSAIGGVI